MKKLILILLIVIVLIVLGAISLFIKELGKETIVPYPPYMNDGTTEVADEEETCKLQVSCSDLLKKHYRRYNNKRFKVFCSIPSNEALLAIYEENLFYYGSSKRCHCYIDEVVFEDKYSCKTKEVEEIYFEIKKENIICEK